jgi:pseudaminic acid cytidylyltransferase
MIKYEKNIGNVAIIPARIGSKRIKKKNIKNFYGKPILELTYDILKKSKLFNKIILSSDSNKILRLGKNIGFDILIKRPKELSDDYTSTALVIKHAINFLTDNCNIKNVCCVYPCNPLIFISDLKKAYFFLKKNKNNFIFPITSHSHPIERSFILNKKNNTIKNINNKFIKYRTQDLTSKYFDVGQFYLASKETWLSKKIINKIGIRIPNWRAVDIDTIQDWKKAELFYEFLKKKKLIK